MQSETNVTSSPKSSESLLPTGSKLNSRFLSPFGRPKWAKRTIFKPNSCIFLIVGIIAVKRVSSVTTFSAFKGALISTLTRAILPLTSVKSLIDFFILSYPLYLIQIYRIDYRAKIRILKVLFQRKLNGFCQCWVREDYFFNIFNCAPKVHNCCNYWN